MVERGAGAHCTTIGGPRRFGGSGVRVCSSCCSGRCSAGRRPCVFSRSRIFEVGGACAGPPIDTHACGFSGRTGGSPRTSWRELREPRNACRRRDVLDAPRTPPARRLAQRRRHRARSRGRRGHAPAERLVRAATEPQRWRRTAGGQRPAGEHGRRAAGGVAGLLAARRFGGRPATCSRRKTRGGARSVSRWARPQGSPRTHIVSGNLAILGECGECGARGIVRTACPFLWRN